MVLEAVPALHHFRRRRNGYRHLLPRGPAPSRSEIVYLYRTIRADVDTEVLAQNILTLHRLRAALATQYSETT